jgi:peroxiredoxin
MALGVGDRAPDFDLPGTGDRRWTLSEFAGQPVVLVFYPGDATPVCTEQLNSYAHDFGQFVELGAQVLALSPQDVASHERFSGDQGGFPFPLLADTDKAVGLAYGILGPIGFYKRSVFVVDAGGIISYAHQSGHGMTYRKTPELLAAIQAAAENAYHPNGP